MFKPEGITEKPCEKSLYCETHAIFVNKNAKTNATGKASSPTKRALLSDSVRTVRTVS